MANIKISSLEETKINNPDASFVMVVAKDDASSLYKNYRISLSELRNIIGSIEGDIVTGVTEQTVIDIVNSAISADNLIELTTGTVSGMIAQAIADIPKVEPGLSESDIQDMIDASISADNSNELTGSVVQGMIDDSITADKLKDTVATVVPSVIPSAEIQLGTPDDQVFLTVKEVAEKVVVQENTVTEITKEIKEECVCDTDAEACFNEIFKYIENI